MPFARLLSLLSVLIAVASGNSVAETLDPHALYEQKCAMCHAPHAGDFVHDSLLHSDDRLLGRNSGQELRAFLEAGHVALSGDELGSLVTHLTAIQKSGRLFHKKCIICHRRAVILARTELVMKGGRLIGRYSKRDMETFLTGHGRLIDDEASRMVDVLKRQLETMER